MGARAFCASHLPWLAAAASGRRCELCTKKHRHAHLHPVSRRAHGTYPADEGAEGTVRAALQTLLDERDMRQRTVRTKVATEKAAQREARAELQTSRMEELYMCSPPHSSILSLFCCAHGALTSEWHCCRQQQLITHEMGRRLKQRMYESSVRHSHHLEQATSPARVCGCAPPRASLWPSLCVGHSAHATAVALRSLARAKHAVPCALLTTHRRSTRIRLVVTDADQGEGLVSR